eukprot:CAMPEP_0115361236 /NCGR_PEP_ID=MMETSP0270-20121206/102100_1 /TAXON_ID=71861 /ORGANISM="Scrippsiella trochoidea, Strain CCMP3099" /LENGTH=401 /DNA_ID=CAMNT_0002783799 /DNA_START=90 /DNA_END=1293 /DNA_ORIENTATION=+
MAALGAFGIKNGNPEVLERFAHGRDSYGRLCGLDPNVTDFRLVYYTLLEGHPPVLNGSSEALDIRKQLIPVCTTKCPKAAAGDEKKNSTRREVDLCPHDEVAAGHCAWYGGNATRLGFYCVDPHVFTSQISISINLQDLQAAGLRLLVAPAAAILLGFLFLGFVHRFGHVCIWVGLLLSAVVPAAFGAWLFHESFVAAGGTHLPTWFSQLHPDTMRHVSYGLWGVSALIFLLACCFAATIRAVISVLKATSDFLTDVPSQMVQPVLVGLVQLAFLGGWMYLFVQVASVGVTEGTNQQKCIEAGDMFCIQWKSTTQRYGLVFFLLMLYWVVNYLHALSLYGTAYAVRDGTSQLIAEGSQKAANAFVIAVSPYELSAVASANTPGAWHLGPSGSPWQGLGKYY